MCQLSCMGRGCCCCYCCCRRCWRLALLLAAPAGAACSWCAAPRPSQTHFRPAACSHPVLASHHTSAHTTPQPQLAHPPARCQTTARHSQTRRPGSRRRSSPPPAHPDRPGTGAAGLHARCSMHSRSCTCAAAVRQWQWRPTATGCWTPQAPLQRQAICTVATRSAAAWPPARCCRPGGHRTHAMHLLQQVQPTQCSLPCPSKQGHCQASCANERAKVSWHHGAIKRPGKGWGCTHCCHLASHNQFYGPSFALTAAVWHHTLGVIPDRPHNAARRLSRPSAGVLLQGRAALLLLCNSRGSASFLLSNRRGGQPCFHCLIAGGQLHFCCPIEGAGCLASVVEFRGVRIRAGRDVDCSTT